VATSSFTCALGGPVTTNSITMTVNVIPSAPVVTPSGATEFCNGGSVTLSSSYATGNVWTPGGATTQDLVVSTSGSYTVVHTSAAGCASSASAPVEVIVNANPVVTITGDSEFCTNLSTVLTADASAGSGTITGYVWTLNGSTVVGSNQTLTAITAGSYTVTALNSNGCFTTSSAFALSGNTPPVVSISGCASILADQTAILTASPAGAAGYEWSLNGGAVLSTDNPYATAAGAVGTYQVKVTDANGCYDSTTTVVSTPIAGPLAGGSSWNIPTNCATDGFPTINSAVNYLNANGVTGTGAITFNVAAGHTETAPSRGITLGGTDPATNTGNNAFLASQTSATPVVFQKAGAGTNPMVSASAAQTPG